MSGKNNQETNEFNQQIGFSVENWEPRQKPFQSVMQGRYCTLEILNIEKHAETLFNALSMDNHGESWTYLPYGPFADCNAYKIWLKATIAESDTLLYAILDPHTKQPMGICGYLRINPEHGSIEVGHLNYSSDLKKTPAATEAMYLMMHHALDDLKYRRYEWKCHSLNNASRAAALRLGFQFEGIFRQCNVFKGHNRDTAWFSIIDREWPALKEKFQQWLDPSNFDQDGKQLNRLRG